MSRVLITGSADVPAAVAALPGDLSSITSTRALADPINAAGVFDAIIHNAGIGYREPTRRETEDDLEHVFQTNVLAPYLLTALVNRPARLVSESLIVPSSPRLY
jgi:NAD(P)-dependent dehydrogenase (short-subunit alcohol dehydrogenase family)